MNNVTFAQMKAWLIAHYKVDRLYGHEDKDKGDRIVKSFLLDMDKNGRSIISRHESNTGKAIAFTEKHVINF